MGGSHGAPFKMKGSGHYGLGNSSPAKAKAKSPTKDRQTWSMEHDRAGAAEHNAQEATTSHHGKPHGPDPGTEQMKEDKANVNKPGGYGKQDEKVRLAEDE